MPLSDANCSRQLLAQKGDKLQEALLVPRACEYSVTTNKERSPGEIGK